MSSVFFSILGIYLFIVVGYVAKMSFKDSIDDKTITILNVYFLQVFLTFWGLMIRPIDITLFYAPSIYFMVVFCIVIILGLLAKTIFKNKKDYSIATVASVIGNTGNLGIPINIAIFGEQSIPYTTLINLINVFIVYTIGVYYYSRGSFDKKTSIKNILKLPILYAAILAIVLSGLGYKPSKTSMNIQMMGAYASITMQLVLFGIYLYGVKINELNKTLIKWVMSSKFIILPLFGFIILSFIQLDNMIKGIIFIELLTPLAVTNVNLASLYDCKPKTTTALVFISSLMFLGIIFIGVWTIKFLG